MSSGPWRCARSFPRDFGRDRNQCDTKCALPNLVDRRSARITAPLLLSPLRSSWIIAASLTTTPTYRDDNDFAKHTLGQGKAPDHRGHITQILFLSAPTKIALFTTCPKDTKTNAQLNKFSLLSKLPTLRFCK